MTTTGRSGTAADEAWMRRALALAARSPIPDPNPRVGCVLVGPAGEVVGQGYHHGAGTPHAEVEALRAAGPAAAGATAYVTLEPCNHTGRTGPCAQALIEARIGRVVHAQADPTPQASGGAATLTAAGIPVTGGVLAGEAAELNAHWTFAQTHGRPFVTWKVAATLDGRTAASDGTSAWITGDPARADVHRLRATAGAIIAGTGSVLADDPRLTVRDPGGVSLDRQPLRVVVGRRRVPAGANVRSADAPTVFTAEPPRGVLALVHRAGVHHAWLEGGARLSASFWTAGLVDRVIVYLAPALLGSGTPLIADLGVTTMADAHRLTLTDLTRIGADIRLTLTPQHITDKE